MTTLKIELLRRWAEELSGASGDGTIRDLEVDFHRAISDNVVRKAVAVKLRMLENDLPSDASDSYKQIEELNSPYYDEWVEEKAEFETDCFDDGGRLVSAAGPTGYQTEDGTFVLKPELFVVPRYISDAEKAFTFKGQFCGGSLQARITEVEGGMLSEFLVTLVDGEGRNVGISRHFLLGAAVVGATLDALIKGWRGLAAIRIDDN